MSANCPHPSQGQRCKQCQIERSNEGLEIEWHECIECGGPAASPTKPCYKCRGDSQ